jgi:hypothetical protein
MDHLSPERVGRDTLVEPPAGVWFSYFGFDPEQLPTFYFVNRSQPNMLPEQQPVMQFGSLSWVVEIAGVALKRHAIIRFRRTGQDEYDYWVYGSEDNDYGHLDWLLKTFVDPLRRVRCRWLII